MEEKATRRVLILCKNPASIAEVKKNYKPEEGDEEHYFFNYNDALEFVIFGNTLGVIPDLLVVDLEAKKCKGHLFG